MDANAFKVWAQGFPDPRLNGAMPRLFRQSAHPIHDMMLRTPDDYAAGIELHTATLAALKRGDPVEIEQEMYRHLGHFEAIVVDVLQRTPHRQMPAFLLAGAS